MSRTSDSLTVETASNAVATIDLMLEVVTIPVSDVERATDFYTRLGWRRDVTPGGSGVIQFTPPGSACSIQFGANRTNATPGSAQNLFLVVSDIEAARDELVEHGVVVSGLFHVGTGGPVSGADPERRSYSTLASFSDPDGNRWLLQEVTIRLPGRIDATTTAFASVSDLANAMRRASVAHGVHEERLGGEYDENWPDWYAAYMVAEQSGVKSLAAG